MRGGIGDRDDVRLARPKVERVVRQIVDGQVCEAAYTHCESPGQALAA
ncbi:MAG TPA: hypothetical protein VGR80_06905 [Steroidobacteraceae bacterium]|nr:hypothetical protein [Steroidobacteraceae bacterium]